MTTFHVPAGLEPGACAAKEATRYKISGVVLHKGNKGQYLLATNASVLSVLPVESADATDKPLLISADACKANGKPAEVTIDGATVHKTIGNKKTLHQLPEQIGRFPAIQSVFPKPEDTMSYRVLPIDANLLHQLAKAISNDGRVCLLIPDATQVTTGIVAVVSCQEDGQGKGIGVIVPLTMDKHQPAAVRQQYAALVADMPDKSLQIG